MQTQGWALGSQAKKKNKNKKLSRHINSHIPEGTQILQQQKLRDKGQDQ